MKRKIVEIDQAKCNGCGQCVPNCAEGALRIVDGKATLVSETFCDGLGACLGRCPQDAIRIVERDADGFDEEAAKTHVGAILESSLHACPGHQVRIGKPLPVPAAATGTTAASQLGHWPIQLHLVPVNAPFFAGADLLIAASCVPFAYAGFHNTLLTGKSLAIACPKLDRTEPYLEKLTEIFRRNDIRSLTVAVMEVPCCQGLVRLARQALHDSGKQMPIAVEVISVNSERK
ncbi:MAG: 4Fe-4S binding protein [Candidatus Edwardsbacteria bacterium]|nr:4Fe-4S binding protein [Candidatus Edwardsbacteria bacterium]